MARHITPATRAKLMAWEGVRLTSYDDGTGVWTIGVGHTGPEVRRGQKITMAQCETLLTKDLARFEAAVSAWVKVPLSDEQFGALVSFAFNIGTGGPGKTRGFYASSALKYVNSGRYDLVPKALMLYTKAGGKEMPGLVKRRRAEVALWNSGGVPVGKMPRLGLIDHPDDPGFDDIDPPPELSDPGFDETDPVAAAKSTDELVASQVIDNAGVTKKDLIAEGSKVMKTSVNSFRGLATTAGGAIATPAAVAAVTPEPNRSFLERMHDIVNAPPGELYLFVIFALAGGMAFLWYLNSEWRLNMTRQGKTIGTGV